MKAHVFFRRKKGMVDVHLNWIFVLVVGALILIFFTSLLLKQRTVSETKYAVAVRQSLDALLVSSQVAVSTASVINTPELDVSFDCDTFFVGSFKSGVSKQLHESRVIFTPSRLKGRQLLAWSQEWNLPYKITDFLYVTSAGVRYIFVYDDENDDKPFADGIKEGLPGQMNVEVIAKNNVAGLLDKNNYKVRFVFFGVDPAGQTSDFALPQSFADNKKTEFSGVGINPNAEKQYGKLVFYRYDRKFKKFDYAKSVGGSYGGNRDASTVPYFDFNPKFSFTKSYPSLYGAIFSDDMEIYGCMMAKAFERHMLVTGINKERADALKSNQAQTNICGFLYEKPDNEFSSLLTALGYCPSSSCYLYPSINELESANAKLQDESCPMVY